MGILAKIALIIRSNLNALVDQAEDPERIIDQLIGDMHEKLREVKLQVTRALKDEKLLQRKAEENHKLVGDYEQRALEAVEKSDDELAREALRRKKMYQGIAESLDQEHQEQQEAVEVLRTSLKALELKIEEAKSKRQILLARKKRAETRLDLADTATENPGAHDLFATFERMADKIASTEAMASATADMERAGLDEKFERLERRASVERELEELKKKHRK